MFFSTYKIQCTAFIRLGLHKSKDMIEIKEINTSHNHLCTPQIVQYYPESRRLSKEEDAKCSEYLKLNVDPLKLRAALEKETSKVILPADIRNRR
jgi:hypothetical protein